MQRRRPPRALTSFSMNRAIKGAGQFREPHEPRLRHDAHICAREEREREEASKQTNARQAYYSSGSYVLAYVYIRASKAVSGSLIYARAKLSNASAKETPSSSVSRRGLRSRGWCTSRRSIRFEKHINYVGHQTAVLAHRMFSIQLYREGAGNNLLLFTTLLYISSVHLRQCKKDVLCCLEGHEMHQQIKDI